MKRLILITGIVLFLAASLHLTVSVVEAQYSSANYNEIGGARFVVGGDIDIVDGGELNIEDGGDFYMEPTDTTPTAAIGWIYFDLSETALTYHNGSGWVTLTTGSGDNTLDDAYDEPTGGAGRTITADTGPVVITNTDADAAYLLSITPTPGSSAATGGIQVTSGANATQDSLNIVNSGSGDDIEAGNGAFTVSSTGAIIALDLDVTGGDITLENDWVLDNSTNNSWKWTENSENMVWTFSNDTLTVSSTTGVVSLDWGALAPTFGSAVVASSGMTSGGDITLANGKALKSSTTSGQTMKLQVYDNDTGPAYKDALTLTNGNTPTMSLGGGAMTVAIDSTDWDISATGAMTGIGAITADGLITGTAGATLSGGAISLNASSNNAVNIGTGTTTSTVTIGGAGVQTINVGDGAAAKTVTLGSSNSTSTTTILSGSGTLLLNNDNNQNTLIGTGTTTGSVTIGGAGAQTIAVGDGAAAKTVSLGSSNSTSTTTILSGSGTLLLNNDNNQSTLIGTGTTTGSVTIGGAGVQTIAVGDGAAAKTVSLGSDNSTSTTTLLSGSGTLKLNVDNNQATNIGTGTSTGTVTIGGAAAQAITIGNGAAVKTVTLGSSDSTSTTNILAGSGDINLTGDLATGDAVTGDGTGALGGFLQTITNDGEPHAVTVGESGTVLTNLASDGADAWTLPTAVAGYEYIFVVMAAQNMQITPAAGDSIIGSGTDVGPGDNYAANAVGETLHLIAVDGTNWIVISETGTWTDSNP